MNEVRVGCSGWNYAHWRDLVYKGVPSRLWLDRYAELFDTVEINNTFYRLPLESSVTRWVEESPSGFLFAVKMSRYITHVKRLTDVGAGVESSTSASALSPVRPRWAPCCGSSPKRFAGTTSVWGPRSRLPGHHCFEFRHASWFAEDVYGLLRRAGAALVIGDHPQRPFQAHELTADWTFVRFHYGSRGRGGNYSEHELEEWARRIDSWRSGADVYAYFNNDWLGHAVRNALFLKNVLAI